MYAFQWHASFELAVLLGVKCTEACVTLLSSRHFEITDQKVYFALNISVGNCTLWLGHCSRNQWEISVTGEIIRGSTQGLPDSQVFNETEGANKRNLLFLRLSLTERRKLQSHGHGSQPVWLRRMRMCSLKGAGSQSQDPIQHCNWRSRCDPQHAVLFHHLSDGASAVTLPVTPLQEHTGAFTHGLALCAIYVPGQ